MATEQTLETFESRRLDAPDLSQFLRENAAIGQWPPSAWNLDALTLVAFFYSPDMDVARARWDVARAGMITAGLRPNPTGTGALGYNSSSSGISPWIPEAVLDLTLETAGKRGIRIDESRHVTEAARLNVLSAAWQVRSRLRSAYLDLFLAQEQRAAILRERDLRAQSVQVLEAQLGIGAISANEVAQARIALDRSAMDELDAAQRISQGRVRLAAALGVPAAALDGVDVSFADLRTFAASLPVQEIRHRALVNRSDLLTALAEYDASQSALRLEIAKQYPDITLGPGFQFDQTDAKWTLGVSLPLPIFHKNEGPIAEAEARRGEMAATVFATQARIIGEIDDAMAAYQSAAGRIAAADALMARLQQQVTLAASTYQLGEISRLELLSAQIELAAGALARLEALGAAQQAAGAVEDAIQSPIDLPDWVLQAPARGSGGQQR